MAIWRYTDAAPDLSGFALADDLADVDSTARATADALAAYLAEQNAGTSGGIAITDDFTGTNNTLPTENWIQDDQNGLRRQSGRLAVTWPTVVGTTRRFWLRSNIPMETDDVSITVVLGTKPP